ncbi:protein kinase domain-containing protein [Streptomyces sp. 8N706]|uniref:protein kinase domain-containing protein n=1 Tax=Streptomyces sp. 8N706 TaxID=3457416 RepID=UPI003FD4731F
MNARQSPFRPEIRVSGETVAGRYRLDRPVGSGGVADVYRGVDLRLRRSVAVKVFRPGTEVEMEERFTEEAVLLARLQHPGLVTVYDAGRHEGCAYLVMQLIEGPTLQQRIATAAMTLTEVCELGTVLAHALAHVHAAGVVHRDVKPSNILLDAAGSPYLTDFGISRLVDTATRTASGALIGTAAYMAPEQVLGRGAGPASDIYALGLVLLECVKGDLEYGGAPLESAVARLHRSPVVPDSLPEELAGLLHAMITLDENARPDAHRCAEALAALCGSRGLTRVPATARNSPGDADAGGIGTVPAEVRTTKKRARPQFPEAAPGRSRRLLLTTGTALLAAILGGTLTASDGPRSPDRDEAASRSSESAPAAGPTSRAPSTESSETAGRPAASPSVAPASRDRSSADRAGTAKASQGVPSGPSSGSDTGTPVSGAGDRRGNLRPGAVPQKEAKPQKTQGGKATKGAKDD